MEQLWNAYRRSASYCLLFFRPTYAIFILETEVCYLKELLRSIFAK